MPILQMSKPKLREIDSSSLMAKKGKGSHMNWDGTQSVNRGHPAITGPVSRAAVD